MYITVEIFRFGKAFDKCLFHQAVLFGILLNYRGNANGIVNLQSALLNIFPQIQVMEKAYCFLTDAALFTIFSTKGVRLSTQVSLHFCWW